MKQSKYGKLEASFVNFMVRHITFLFDNNICVFFFLLY